MGETTDQLIEKVRTLLQAEDDESTKFLTGIDEFLPKVAVKQEAEVSGNDTSLLTSALGKMNFGLGHVTKLRKFEKGENFSRFCERFQEYVQMTDMKGNQLHFFFLQHVDDETYSTLKAVNLKEEEKQNCALFCELYKKAIYGTDSVPLKNEVLECKQETGESISTFSHRIREKASVAFSTVEAIDENSLLALMRGIRNSDIRRKLAESTVSTFSEALKLAKKLEKISSMFESEIQPASILKSSTSFFDQESQKEKQHNTADSSSRRDRSRHSSADSRGSYHHRSDSPWPRGRNDWSRTSRSRARVRENPPARTRSSSAFGHERRMSRSRARSVNPPNRRESRRCWKCNRLGHIKRNCYARNRAAIHPGRNAINNLN